MLFWNFFYIKYLKFSYAKNVVGFEKKENKYIFIVKIDYFKNKTNFNIRKKNWFSLHIIFKK
jgi:hypothetical protein